MPAVKRHKDLRSQLEIRVQNEHRRIPRCKKQSEESCGKLKTRAFCRMRQWRRMQDVHTPSVAVLEFFRNQRPRVPNPWLITEKGISTLQQPSLLAASLLASLL